jgi:hypothetical protein
VETLRMEHRRWLGPPLYVPHPPSFPCRSLPPGNDLLSYPVSVPLVRFFRLLCEAVLGNFTAEARRAQRKLGKSHCLNKLSVDSASLW